jgi:molybdopterin-guanine dinucleotide biosynthesis protein A
MTQSPARPSNENITGLVLCGGRGTRMGGVDKGLQHFNGLPLAMNALLRLGPQVGRVMINANRNPAAYESMGVPVWPDSLGDFQGPLAGWLAGLEHCETPFMVTVPCDTPNFPLDLVARLAAALVAEGAELAMAATLENGALQVQPVFCLLRVELRQSLVASLHAGDRKVERWTALHHCATVLFEDNAAFANANTAHELDKLQTESKPGQTGVRIR